MNRSPPITEQRSRVYATRSGSNDNIGQYGRGMVPTQQPELLHSASMMHEGSVAESGVKSGAQEVSPSRGKLPASGDRCRCRRNRVTPMANPN